MTREPHSSLDTSWQPLRGPFTRWPRTTDTVLAVAAFIATVAVSITDPDQAFVNRTVSEIPLAAYALFALAGGALIWRRSQPLIVQAVVLATSALAMGFGYFDGPVLALPVSIYSAGRYATHDHGNYIGVGCTITLVGIGSLWGATPTVDIAPALIVTFLLWYIGRRIRARREYLELLQERAASLEREQAAEAHKVVTEERTRIARELHDVVAHQVSLMTVQAGAAKTVAAENPQAAQKAMEAVEQAGRQALDELRHLLGVLRPKTEINQLDPQRGLADIPRLVEDLRKTGLEIVLTMSGEQTPLPARVNLSTYRIVQESLTNVLKHAGPHTRTEVGVCIDSHNVVIEVLDNGVGVTTLPESGHGIAGMRERAHLLGGDFNAGPRPGNGFQVVARLPINEESL